MGTKCDFSSEREQHRLRMFETGVLWSMLTPKKEAGENYIMSTFIAGTHSLYIINVITARKVKLY
jgi:hypothetical protein